MRRGILRFLAWTATVLCLGGVAWGMDEAALNRLIERRTAVCHHEGQRLGDLVLGSRATFEFVLVDRTLSEALGKEVFPPEWLRYQGRHFGSDAVRGKTLFAVRFVTAKPMTFDPTRLWVGQAWIRPEDVLTRSDLIPREDLPSGVEVVLAVAAPGKLAPGKTVLLGYGDDRVSFDVPVR